MACLQTMMMNVRDLWEDQLRIILEEIARDHKLDSKSLVGRYILRGQKDLSPVTLSTYPVPEGLPQPAPAPRAQAPRVAPPPRAPGSKNRGGRKPRFGTPPKLDGELTEDFLRTLTNPLLQEACKMRQIAVTGGKDVLVGRILTYQSDPGAHKPPRKGGRKKKSQAPEPVHNHALDDRTHPDCEQCKIYGNPLDPGMQKEEFQVTASPLPSPGIESAPEPAAPPVPREIESAPASPQPPVPPVPQEFEMDDGDIDAQLKAIVDQMNGTTLGSEPPMGESYDEDVDEDEDEDEDPFGRMDYGDMLEEED